VRGHAMRGLIVLLLFGCGPPDETSAYLGDAQARRDHLRAALVNPENRYSRLRLEHYSRDWDELPEWDPPVTPLAGESGDVGRDAFFRYPAQLVPFSGGAPGLVSVRFSDGTDGTAMTCSTCHARDGVPGLPAQDFDLGALVGADWGPGRVDVAVPSGEEPVAIPDLRSVALQTHLHRDGTLRNDRIALAIRIETLIVTAHGQSVRPPRRIALALADYLRSLAPPEAADPPPVFAACARCHPPPAYSGPPVALADVGTDPRVGLSADRGTGGYRAPSLRGVSTRGRLLHDGSVGSVEELLDPARTVRGHRFGLDLPAEKREELLAFLRSL
jgi:cytochrome c553